MMLRQCAAHADGWNAWYAWFGNDVAQLPVLLAEVDVEALFDAFPRARFNIDLKSKGAVEALAAGSWRAQAARDAAPAARPGQEPAAEGEEAARDLPRRRPCSTAPTGGPSSGR